MELDWQHLMYSVYILQLHNSYHHHDLGTQAFQVEFLAFM
jgi:hypothetical protein